jgi:hypothetical protein
MFLVILTPGDLSYGNSGATPISVEAGAQYPTYFQWFDSHLAWIGTGWIPVDFGESPEFRRANYQMWRGW